MDKLKLEIDLPPALYEKLGAFILQKIDEGFTERAKALQRERVKLTRIEAAKRLRVSLPTLDKLKNDGVLKFQTAGKRILFCEDVIEEYLNRGR